MNEPDDLHHLTKDRNAAFPGMYEENCARVRRRESQRATASNITIKADAGLVSLKAVAPRAQQPDHSIIQRGEPTMRLYASALYIALLCGGSLLPLGSSHARTPQTPQLQGTYTLDAAASDDVRKAIDIAVRGMGWPKEGFARSRLEKTNLPPYQRVVIQLEPGVTGVSITTDKRAPIRTSADGTPIDWTREDKEKFKVSTVLKTGPLVQTFKSKDGQRVNTYSISADGKTLVLNVSVTSDKLPRPLTYRLVYKRAT